MAKIGVFTIGSKNYLAYARTLLASVSKHNPEYETYLCLADQIDDHFDPEIESFTTITSDQLNIPTFDDMTLRYNIMEFNTAVKPFMFGWLFEKTDLDAIIYLDPDILAYSTFDELEKIFQDGASVILTPHYTKPLEDGCIPDDYNMMRTGVFNLGFIAARRCQEAIDYMQWWGRRLSFQCIADFSKNLFVDQKWCDLAPCFLENLHVLKHPGYNVAYWNLAERDVKNDGDWTVNNQPLAFFHFSGVHPEKKHIVSKYQDRFNWGDIKPLQPLFENYAEQLLLNGWKKSTNWPYAYSTLIDKTAIPDSARKLYHLKTPKPLTCDKAEIEKHFVDLCNEKTKDIRSDKSTTITQLMHFIYQDSSELQHAFNLSSKNGRQEYVSWFNTAGLDQYGLSDKFSNNDSINITPSARLKILSLFLKGIMNIEKAVKRLSKCIPKDKYDAYKDTYFRCKNKFIGFIRGAIN